MRLSYAVPLCAFALAFPATAAADVVVTSSGIDILVQGDDAANQIETSGPVGGPITILEIGAADLVDNAVACQQEGPAVICTVENFSHVTVRGGAGDDVLEDRAAAGSYTYQQTVGLYGDEGEDELFGNRVTDLDGGPDDDRVQGNFGISAMHPKGTGGAGDDVLVATESPTAWVQEPGADTYLGTTAADKLVHAAGPVTLTLDGLANDGREGENDNIGDRIGFLFGTAAADRIDLSSAPHGVTAWGRGGDDEIIGSPFADDLEGDAGADRVDGAGGDDRFAVPYGADTLRGGDGRDTLTSAHPLKLSMDGVANDGIHGTADVASDIEVIHGSVFDDVIVGGAGDHEIWGAEGADVLDGGLGNDHVFGGPGSDTLRGRDGSVDQLDCGEDADPGVEADDDDVLEGCELIAPWPPPPPPPAPPAPQPTATAAALDLRAPFVGIRSARLRGRTLRAMVSVDEVGLLVAEVRSGLRRIGRASRQVVAGSPRLVIRLRRGVRLARTLSLRVSVTDVAGNRGTRTRRLTLKR